MINITNYKIKHSKLTMPAPWRIGPYGIFSVKLWYGDRWFMTLSKNFMDVIQDNDYNYVRETAYMISNSSILNYTVNPNHVEELIDYLKTLDQKDFFWCP